MIRRIGSYAVNNLQIPQETGTDRANWIQKRSYTATEDVFNQNSKNSFLPDFN